MWLRFWRQRLASGQQIGDSVYWVYFTDKSENGYQSDLPGEFLSERSIQRRAWQGLGIGLTDQPVTRAYVDTLVEMGVEVRHISRWLNGLVMVNADEDLFHRVLELPFVDTLAWIPESQALWFTLQRHRETGLPHPWIPLPIISMASPLNRSGRFTWICFTKRDIPDRVYGSRYWMPDSGMWTPSLLLNP